MEENTVPVEKRAKLRVAAIENLPFPNFQFNSLFLLNLNKYFSYDMTKTLEIDIMAM